VAGFHLLMDVFGLIPVRLTIAKDQPPSGRFATAAFSRGFPPQSVNEIATRILKTD
jgi:hypothetical protein